MVDIDRDTAIRIAAFEHVQRLHEVHGQLTARELKPGFVFENQRIPLVNPQRGIFKPKKMRFLLSIRTVFPRPGGKVWYDDQRQVHRQIYEGDETIDYAFMGQNPEAADNLWLRAAFANRIPVIYFLGIAPGLSGDHHETSVSCRVQRVTGIPTRLSRVKLVFNVGLTPIQGGRNPSISTVCVPSEGGKRRRARHLWYDYGACLRRYRRSGPHSTVPPPRDPPRVAQCGHGSPGAAELKAASSTDCTIRDTRVRSCHRGDSCCWGRAGATSPTTACVRIRRSGHGGLGGGPRAGDSRPCPDCWTRSAGRRTFRSPGGDGAGVPSDRESKVGGENGGKRPHGRRDGKRRCTWNGLPVEVHGREANG